ncbi:MAG: hypothetical protein L6R48_10575 [Planctomycetes bacterium]|nr:hypothetical protein [Planctomycetota bacterium]
MIRPAPGGRAWALALGLLSFHLALWIGPFGYKDLFEYATITEQLWRHGTFALTDGEQSRFCWGFPVLCLPWQALGAGFETLTGADEASRWFLAAFPLLATIACSLLVLLAPGQADRRDRHLAALLLGLSAPALYYSRMLHLEPVTGLALMAGTLLGARQGPATSLAAGACLGMALSCHFAYAPGVAVLGLGCAWLRWSRGDRLAALALLGILGAISLLTPAINAMRYGSPWSDGYSRGEQVGWQAAELWRNLPWLGLVLAATPWLLPTLLGTWRRFPQGAIIGLACCCQTLAWLGTWQFSSFPLRYLMAWTMLAGLLLPEALHRLRSLPRWGAVILRWGVLACLLATALVLAGWQESRPFIIDHNHVLYPGQLLTNVWYVAKDPPYLHGNPYQWFHPQLGEVLTPYCPLTWSGLCAALALVASGLGLVLLARPPAKPGSAPTAPGGRAGAHHPAELG